MGAFSQMTSMKIESGTLIRAVGTGRGPLLVDVRRRVLFDTTDRMLPAAVWRDHMEAPRWGPELRAAWGARDIVVYCAHGHQLSQAATGLLRSAGIPARFLVGGIETYTEAGGPLVAKTDNDRAVPSHWVTRERPKIDRIACPWFIRRFIDPLAEIHFTEPEWVTAMAAEIGAVAFDVDGGDITHDGPRCSFDTLLERYAIDDPALLRLAEIVRGADTARLDLAPEAAGLLAMSLGLSAAGDDDHETMERGFVLYDALYDWARFAADETHNWPAAAGARS